MTTISIETAQPQAKAVTKSQKQDDAKHQPQTVEDPRGAGDAERFKGQPLVIFPRLERCMSELAFYRASLRHRGEAETSDVRSHDEWKRAACALARELANEIESGLMEPNAAIQQKLNLAQALIDEALRAQRNG